MKLDFNYKSSADYDTFLKVRQCPVYRFRGAYAHIPDEYSHHLGERSVAVQSDYLPHGKLFDYQRDIAAIAIQKRKYAIFADCGLGKTLMLLEYARHCAAATCGTYARFSLKLFGDASCFTRIQARLFSVRLRALEARDMLHSAESRQRLGDRFRNRVDFTAAN